MAKHSPQHLKAMASRGPRPKQASKLIPASKLPRNLSADDIAWVKSMVIYEDADIMGFNKPSGLSSQGGRGDGHNLDDMMWAFAKSNGKRPKLVHRLDRDTSGILLVAKTQPAVSFLGKAMIRRAFDKTYLAIVSGAELPDRFTVDAPLRREEVGREAWSRVCAPDHPDALTAQTTFEVLKRGDDAALIQCSPHTGRMHQIRVHLAHLGTPIAGDVRYGGALSVGGRGVPRLMLHALSLTFPHPAGGDKTLSAPIPEDFDTLALSIQL
ncbi:RNA pseudouridylate synthase family protein [Asticcacaulis biprosthecium C19]|uniref:RNA pseudouridylate synthase family protein n=1 Tax=Asticcacaulis biprosthecium C19 TaxID=715226 RepID=F4QRK7_9CAUL|nr:RluA family pseudouridine synthase [Asticcacaulis biprosthecium]EGF90133.1 RNA pseudouridylate synthase family protein [Asticcacaulis biprosthecium C19]